METIVTMPIEKSPLNRRRFLSIAAGAMGAAGYTLAESNRPLPDREPFTFAVIADPHCAEEPKAGIEEYGNGVDKLLRCFETIKNLPAEEQPDFALLAGDIHPETLAPHLDKITLPIHSVAGNHEGTPQTRGLLRELFPGDFRTGKDIRDYYSFTHKGVRFIGVCDAGAGGEHVGQFCSELIEPAGQCDWLERELEATGFRKVVFAHIPPALDGGDRNMYMSRNDSRWFLELVRRTVPEMLFFGHLHHAMEEYEIGGTQGVNLRSCCWNFNQAPIGFMLVHVTTDGMKTREIFTGTYKFV
jgi:predicted phosphodiesterase